MTAQKDSLDKGDNKAKATTEKVVASAPTPESTPAAPIVAKEPIKKVKKLKNFLENRIVKIVPVAGTGKWSTLLVNGKDVDNEPFILKRAKRSFQLPFFRQGGLSKIFDNFEQFYTVQFPNEKLTQQGFFEKIMGCDMGTMTVPNEISGIKNFWKTDARGRVTVTREGLRLDLSDPLHMVHYMILKKQAAIASSWETRFDGNFDFAIVDENKVLSQRLEDSKSKAKAYALLAELMGSDSKMVNFIKSMGNNIPARYNTDYLKDKVMATLERDHNKFLEIVEDELFDDKVFIYDALRVEAIKKVAGNIYALDNGKEVGELRDMAYFLRDPENQELKMQIENRINRTR